jgi:hypothetical protein
VPTTADQDRKFAATTQRYATANGTLLTKLLKYLLTVRKPQKQRYADWTMAESTIAQTLPVLDSYLHQQRLLSRTYATQVLRDLDAAPRTLPRLEDVYPRSGVTAFEVYKRPVETFWYEGQKGATPEEAERKADERFFALLEQDMALARRDETQKVYASSKKVIGRRRILHPELALVTHHSCGLCIAAATRFYTVDELLPLHGGCHCTDAPILEGEKDPGLRLNREDLDKLYAAAGSTAAADLRRIQVEINEHGELGPILTRKGQEFRDSKEANALSERKTFAPFTKPTLEQQKASWASMRDTSQRAIEKLREAKASGASTVNFGGKYSRDVPIPDVDKAIAYHQDLIDRYGALLK